MKHNGSAADSAIAYVRAYIVAPRQLVLVGILLLLAAKLEDRAANEERRPCLR